MYDLSEAKTIFKNIIESDLRFIGHKYKGLAKFLYYWGCLYSKYKHLAISYESFYKIASSYDDSSNLLKITNRWDINIPEMERIKFYLQKKEHNLIDERVQLIQFNHDILADVGLSKIYFNDWDLFGDVIKIDFLKILIEDNNFIASNYLETMLINEPQIFIDDNERFYYMEKLLNRTEPNSKIFLYDIEKLHSNLILQNEMWRQYEVEKIMKFLQYADNHVAIDFSKRFFQGSDWAEPKLCYLHGICWDLADENILREFADNFLSSNGYFKLFTVEFEEISQYATPSILKTFSDNCLSGFAYQYLDYSGLNICLSNGTPEIVKIFCEKILNSCELEPVPNEIIIDLSFKFVSKRVIEKFYDKYLTNEEWKKLDIDYVISCLNYCSKNKISQFAQLLLNDNEWERYSFLICGIIDFVTQDVSKNIANRLLKKNNMIEILGDGIFKCFKYVSKKEVNIFVNRVLFEDYYWMNLDESLVYECLRYASIKAKIRFCNEVLSIKDIDQCHLGIVNYCVNFISSL